ncbi:tetrameric acyl-CoA thioesterase [Alcanivorax sp. N3-2A]|nr:tetrameric acyl-CoA thioesterase [Alcanivorax sp. N3-2A]|tara:strand:- start:2776 stop:3282 length:507 start_codon:yes stop_codon:yes gene_type:complete
MGNPLRKLFSGAAGLRRGLLLYGPFLGAGVRVDTLSKDFRYVRVSMGMHWYNRNYVGTHFGGSLYSMTDPFYMLMLINNLGGDYIVWDKSARIDFVSPGKGRVFAEFELTDAMLNEVRAATAGGDKYLPTWPVTVRDGAGNTVAEVSKTLYVRKKRDHHTPASGRSAP